MNTSKNHHYVAKAILRRFCISNETTLRLERDNKLADPEPKNIDRVFQRFHLNNYELDSGRKKDDVEKFFAHEFDNFIPEWIDVFETATQTGRISFSDTGSRFRFIQFYYNHMKRTPDFIDPIVAEVSDKVFHPNVEQELEQELRKLTDEEKKRLHDPEWRRRTVSNSRVQNFGSQSEKILDILADMKIFIASPDTSKKQFIVASNPVARFESYAKQQLGEAGVELWTTMTPSIAVGFAKTDRDDGVLTLDTRAVRKLNRAMARQSTSIAGRSAKLLVSIGRSVW